VRRRWPRVLAGVLLALCLAAGAGFGIASARLHDSLPAVRGELVLPGLGEAVRVERDALGVPVIRGRSRADVARATGFVHAQERFFQMDLLRRRAAGELSALVGKAALPADREVRPLRLRSVARRATASLPAGERALLAAYTDGVNAGLSALRAAPFEYLLLRSRPSPWLGEDSLLCALTMYLTLQGELAEQESTLGLMHDLLPPALFEFLTPRGTEWDAPLSGVPFVQPALPGKEVVDLRRQRPAVPPPLASAEPEGRDEFPSLGSNNWAVDAAHSATGAAILANDMHLGLGVPNTWYRASLVFEQDGAERRITGVMLPGAPFVVVGSNGHVAWGFTNSQGDWADLVILDPDPSDTDAYRTPEGPRRFGHESETIQVKGGDDVELEVLETVWGPVVDTDHNGHRRALAWVALRDGGVNAALVRMERVSSLAEAQALGPECGIPDQNLVVADTAGHVGWTIAGRIPRRFGHDGRLPVSWADGSSGWDGWLPPEEYPRIVDPPSGRIQTANSRVVDGEDLRKVGFGGYDLGARQRQIRDDLLAVERASEADMLKVQLDDRAVFLERWQRLLLALLTPEATAGQAPRGEARALVESWGGHASTDSAGYRIVRAFRLQVAQDVFAPIVAPCTAADPKFDYLGTRGGWPSRGHRQWEGPLWALVTLRPPHLLDPAYPSWEARLLASLDAALQDLTREGGRLAERTWGERNTTRIDHPLARALPLVGGWLDMPHHRLPGDSHMPRVQSPGAGASERLAVSPGHEGRGYFHMPAGESGHPRSPHYGDGHAAWERGEPTPFLPGPAVEVLTLVPAR